MVLVVAASALVSMSLMAPLLHFHKGAMVAVVAASALVRRDKVSESITTSPITLFMRAPLLVVTAAAAAAGQRGALLPLAVLLAVLLTLAHRARLAQYGSSGCRDRHNIH